MLTVGLQGPYAPPVKHDIGIIRRIGNPAHQAIGLPRPAQFPKQLLTRQTTPDFYQQSPGFLGQEPLRENLLKPLQKSLSGLQGFRPADACALEALESDKTVKVEIKDNYIAFIPRRNPKKQGLLFFPGAYVEPSAYARSVRQIAQKGHVVVVLNTPWCMVGLGQEKADEARQVFDMVEKWAVGGHSAGGHMANHYAKRHADKISGVVFWGSFPIFDLSRQADLKALYLQASEDRLLNRWRHFMDPEKCLPQNTTRVTIEGGNHANFADYKPSRWDGKAAISAKDQQKQTAQATSRFLASL